MKFFLALCFVAAVAQAIDVDWDSIITLEVFPEGLLEQITESGLKPEDVEGRITNGLEASHGQFPYQVALFCNIGTDRAFCGGSILNNEWILTAAHCVDSADSVDVVFAAQNIRDTAEEGQFTIRSSKIVVHENWNPRTIANDVALIKLSTPVQYSDRVQPTRLPGRSQVSNTFSGSTGTVSGWGRDSDRATTISPVLRYTSNNIIQNLRCNVYFMGQISRNQVCLSGSGGRSSCNGDSGGPLVVTDRDGEVTQIGIVSFGIALGCSIGWPGVYVRTTHYLDWIAANSENSYTVRA